MTKPLKVGLRAGGTPPDELLWSVHYLTVARDEAMSFLTEAQYAHVVDGFEALARQEDPRRPTTQRVEQVEDFYEFKDKGGILAKINLRVYFAVLPTQKTIVALHTIKKEADGQTPRHVKILVGMRLRRLRAGDYGPLP